MQSLTEIVQQIKEAVKVAANTPYNPEGKLRELVSPIWERFLKEKRVGLSLQIRDELTLANGRADTVFNKLILEYKKPYTIKSDNDKNRKLISQVQGYIFDLAKKERFSKERLLGVAFDGDHLLFMRHVNRWIVEEPLPLSEESLDFFLKNLEKLTSKAALIPENLIRDFAVGRESRNKVAVDCIKAFYKELHQHGSEGDTKEHVFFDQWKIQFAEVHGSLEEKKIDKEKLFTSYGFNKKEQEKFDVHAFFFALDSYFALLMKLLAYQVVGYYTLSKISGLPLREWESLSSDDLKYKCEELEDGGIFRKLDIRNFLEGDLLSWYTQAWNNDIYEAVKQIIGHLNDYDPETMEIAPDETRDILKKLYQHLVPKEIRHDLGEYYTPDWLADRCLNQLTYDGNLNLRVLDPSCGSGTFIVLSIKRAKEYAKKKNIDDGEALRKILAAIQGFDLNPLAVTAARTNYMMAIADLLKAKKGEITIPVYLCDSINPPQARKAHEMTLFEERVPYEVRTTVGKFLFSRAIVSKQRIQQLANIMDDFVKQNKSNDDFLKKIKSELSLSDEEYIESEKYLLETYEKLTALEKRGINGIWSRIIKNAFAPLFVGQYNLIVGNPPWVNWEALPHGYRDDTKPLWINYGLFSLTGHEARLGGGKKDISMLLLYVAIDKYLIDEGKLCFVITQSIFKSQGAGDGFRRFQLGDRSSFKIEQVDDMVELQPFEGAVNRTCVVTIKKSQKTIYPVSYVYWKKIDKGSISLDLTFKEVLEKTKRVNLKAKPIGESNSSPWISAKEKALKAVEKVVGQADYKAVAGSCTWLTGVYWGDIDAINDKLVRFSNLHDEGKIKIMPTTETIESILVYPLLRGREVAKWKSLPSHYIIQSQNPITRTGYDYEWMTTNAPLTLKYFDSHRTILESRSGYKKYLDGEPYYSIYNVSEKTLAPYKVVWKEQSTEFQCAVVSSCNVGDLKKVIIPDHKLMCIPFSDIAEAHYVAALLNSSVAGFIVMAYAVSTQQSTHILEHIKIPKYDSKSVLHKELSRLSALCHEKAASGIEIKDLEETIDELAGELWELSMQELEDVKDSVEALK